MPSSDSHSGRMMPGCSTVLYPLPDQQWAFAMTDETADHRDSASTDDTNCASGNRPTHISIEVATQLSAIQPRLYGFILKRLANHEQAAEVLQKTNLAICENAARYTPDSNFSAWAFTVARFQLLAWRTTASRNRLVFTDSLHETIDNASDATATAHDDRVLALRDCLTKLKHDDLRLIQQRYRDATALADLAKALQKSVDAIGMRLSRLRRQLADCIRNKLQAQLAED